MNGGAKVSGAMSRLGKAGSLSMDVKRKMYERIVGATVLYGV